LKLRAIGYLAGLFPFSKAGFYAWCRQHGCYSSPFAYGKLEFTKGRKAQEHMAKIREGLGNLTIGIRMSDIPDFPDGLVEANLYDLSAEYTAEIQKIYDEMDEALKKPNVNELTELIRARQRTELIKVPLLVDLVKDAVDEEGNSAVVFVGFRETVQRLRREFPGAAVIIGDQKPEERQQAIDDFQANRKHVCLATFGAGGCGLSIHDITQTRPRVSFLTPGWSASDTVQALGRIRRVGGTPVRQTFVLVAGTIEERIHKAVSRKLANISTLNDGDLT
jgi:superfamily II DNA/RNA helicase